MSNSFLIKAAIGVIVLALGLLMFSSMSTEDKSADKKAKTDETNCPDCGKPYPKGQKKDCPYCKIARGGKPKETASSSGGQGKTKYVLAGLISFLVVGTSFLLYRQMRGRGPYTMEEVFHFRCPSCKRKIGFRPRKAGKEVMCPGCRKSVRLPKLD